MRKAASVIEVVVILLVLVTITMFAISKLGPASSQGGFGRVNVAFGSEDPSSLTSGNSPSSNHPQDGEDATAAQRKFNMRLYVVLAFVLAALAFIFKGPAHNFALNKRFIVSRVEQRCADEATNGSQELIQKRQRIYRGLTEGMLGSHNANVSVAAVMSRNVSRVEPGYAATEIQAEMKQRGFHHLMVCTADNQLVGVISDRDLTKRNAKTAADYMTPRPITVSSESTLNAAISVLVLNRFSCLPVVDDDKLVGILTTSDLAVVLQCVLSILSETMSVIQD